MATYYGYLLCVLDRDTPDVVPTAPHTNDLLLTTNYWLLARWSLFLCCTEGNLLLPLHYSVLFSQAPRFRCFPDLGVESLLSTQ